MLGSFREAIRIQADSFTAHLNLSRTLHHLGRLDEAVTAYREVLRLRPGGPSAFSLEPGVSRPRPNRSRGRQPRESLRLTPNNPERTTTWA